MKLIINSNLNYKTPLLVLFESLVRCGFKKFEDVVVVIGQSDIDSEPERTKISDLMDLDINSQVVVIRKKLNNYDYGGYHALSLHMDHPLIQSESFMYLLDTTTVEQEFVSIFDSLSVGSGELVISNAPHSNICAFGHEVVRNYGDNFGTVLTKDEAIRLEWNAPIEKNVNSIVEFGKARKTRSRIVAGEFDIYKTQMPRVRTYYPDFGVNKWILWGRNGDIVGKLEKNNPFPELEEDGKVN